MFIDVLLEFVVDVHEGSFDLGERLQLLLEMIGNVMGLMNGHVTRETDVD